MRLHIHFGIHRTGTTAIHSILMNNSEVLKEKGILYPNLGVNHRHYKTAWSLINKTLSPTELIKKINSELQSSHKMILLSAEDFSLLKNTAWLVELSKNYELTASIYLRRQDFWLESWYNQNIKWPWNKKFSQLTIGEFLENKKSFYWLDYNWLIEKITTCIPVENVKVWTFDKDGVENTSEKFLSYLNIDITSLQLDVKNENKSLSSAQLQILRRIGLYELSPQKRMRIINAIRQINIVEDDGISNIIHDEDRIMLLNYYKKSNYLVAKKFFNREELFSLTKPKISKAFLTDDIISNRYLGLVSKKLISE